VVSQSFPIVSSGKRGKSDLYFVRSLIQQRLPFTFIRFSDGEMEILRNSPLEIAESLVRWSKGMSSFSYPSYDFKVFDPERNEEMRSLLLASAEFTASNYFKGIPTRHNRVPVDTQFMVSLNGGITNLTFADLFLNSNYQSFVNEVLPLIVNADDVLLIGNYRMQVERLNPNWQFLPIPDNAFNDFVGVVETAVTSCLQLPEKFTILSSASSLSNVIGHQLRKERPDLTFIDVGTTLHPFTGMPPSNRSYLSQTEPWALKNSVTKLKYLLSPGRKLTW